MISPELLRRYAFFGGLNEDELPAIAMIAEEVAYPAGAIIFREGETATAIYVLTFGNVELIYEIERPGGADVSYVGSIAPGEAFGISAFVEPYRLSATAKAEGAVRAVVIDAASLRTLCEKNCHLGYTVMCQVARTLAERLSLTRVQLAACG